MQIMIIQVVLYFVSKVYDFICGDAARHGKHHGFSM